MQYVMKVRFVLSGNYKPRSYMVAGEAKSRNDAGKKAVAQAKEMLVRFVPESKIVQVDAAMLSYYRSR